MVKLGCGDELLQAPRGPRSFVVVFGGSDCRPFLALFTSWGHPGDCRVDFFSIDYLYVMASACDIAWIMIEQAAKGVGDAELDRVVDACEPETGIQIKWLKTRMKQAAPQALIVAD
ncbi:MAG: hypothetical protein H0U65_13715 [Rubrobacter sp.]|nr:hypothetical protein [Rubrobacter sp.]